MFDNPEKLFILFVIALMILGPSKLASLGASLGRTIRDFRASVRGAHDEFRSAVQEHVDSFTPALPAPDPEPMPLADASAMPVDYGSPMTASAVPDSVAVSAEPAAAASPETAVATAPDDDRSSLASEPTAADLRKAGAYR
jgi:TatA/E family protein of Tat protein translocase